MKNVLLKTKPLHHNDDQVASDREKQSTESLYKYKRKLRLVQTNWKKKPEIFGSCKNTSP